MAADLLIHRSIGALYNALKLNLNNKLADDGLEPMVDIRPDTPLQSDVEGRQGSPDRTLGVYSEGEHIFQQTVEGEPLMFITVDMVLRDEDAQGTRQTIYKYADVLREFIDAQRIGLSCIVVDESIIRPATEHRSRVYCIVQIKFDPTTDIDEQGLEDPAV